MPQRKVIVITGPTATGKTALGVAAAKALGGEIISADSMQIYRGMDIGTAKVTAEEACGITHHMVDVADPEENFSVSRYVEMAAACCEDIFARGKTPIIVGGTGLYIDSLLSGRSFAEGPGDTELRETLGAQYDDMGGAAFLEKLREIDPLRAEKLHPADKKRIVRALEVYQLTGKTITEHDEETRLLPPRYDSVRFALSFEDRQELYRRIDLRVDMMLSAGLENEVRSLLQSGLSENCTAMQAIGYKEMAEYINGKCSLQEASDSIKQNSRRYAKRQLTWLRRDGEINWIMRRGAADIGEDLRFLLSHFE